jgi:hypothetical protein
MPDAAKDTRNELNRKMVDFIKIDLDIGLTFAQTALQSDNPETIARTLRAARKVYDQLGKLLSRVRLTAVDSIEIAEKTECLKSALTKLSEKV